MSQDGGNMKKGGTMSDEQKLKISEANKGKKSWNRGIPLTEAQKKKISIANTGKPSWNKGRTTPEAVKRKLSQARMGVAPWNRGLTLVGNPKYARQVANIRLAAKKREERKRNQERETMTPRPNNLYVKDTGIKAWLKNVFGIID